MYKAVHLCKFNNLQSQGQVQKEMFMVEEWINENLDRMFRPRKINQRDYYKKR